MHPGQAPPLLTAGPALRRHSCSRTRPWRAGRRAPWPAAARRRRPPSRRPSSASWRTSSCAPSTRPSERGRPGAEGQGTMRPCVASRTLSTFWGPQSHWGWGSGKAGRAGASAHARRLARPSVCGRAGVGASRRWLTWRVSTRAAPATPWESAAWVRQGWHDGLKRGAVQGRCSWGSRAGGAGQRGCLPLHSSQPSAGDAHARCAGPGGAVNQT